jgi:hypothetical protein
MASDLGIGRAIFETDSELMSSTITSNNYDLAPNGALFCETKYQLRTSFTDYQFTHQFREGNKPAHVLAGLGAQAVTSSSLMWLESPPVDVLRLLSGDIAAQV